MKGSVKAGFEAVGQAFRANFAEREEAGASCCVTVDGEVVADLWGGEADPESGRAWEEDTVSVVFSATKGATAICAHHLIDQGSSGCTRRSPTSGPNSGRAPRRKPPCG